MEHLTHSYLIKLYCGLSFKSNMPGLSGHALSVTQHALSICPSLRPTSFSFSLYCRYYTDLGLGQVHVVQWLLLVIAQSSCVHNQILKHTYVCTYVQGPVHVCTYVHIYLCIYTMPAWEPIHYIIPNTTRTSPAF